MIRRPPRSTPLYSSAASDVYKRQVFSFGLSILLSSGIILILCSIPTAGPNQRSLIHSPLFSLIAGGEIDAQLLRGSEEIILILRHFHGTAFLTDHIHVQPERLHLLQ